MGTPAIVAIGTEKRWRGRWVDYDGYPSRVGKDVFEYCRWDDVDKFRRLLRIDNNGFISFPDKPKPSSGRARRYFTKSDLTTNLGCFWLYIVDPIRNRLYIFERVVRQRDLTRRCSRCSSLVQPRKQPIRWRRIASLSLSGKEPDWEAIKARAE